MSLGIMLIVRVDVESPVAICPGAALRRVPNRLQRRDALRTAWSYLGGYCNRGNNHRHRKKKCASSVKNPLKHLNSNLLLQYNISDN